MDVASDDRVILTLQYSTQWDTLAHVGGLFDADGDGVPEPLYYNGFKAGSDIVGPQPDAGRDGCGHMSYAHKLGVENMAAKAIQGRAVMVDLEKHYGRDHKYVNYDDFRRVLEADKVVVEPGDMLLLYTGFTDEIVKMDKKIDPARVPRHVLRARRPRQAAAAVDHRQPDRGADRRQLRRRGGAGEAGP